MDLDSLFHGDDAPVGMIPTSGLRITRRAFIGGMALSPLLQLPDAMAAQGSDMRGRTWELSLEVLEDPGGHVLLVREYCQPCEKTAPCVAPNQAAHDDGPPPLRIPAAAFGPEAWFDMDRPPAPELMPPHERSAHDDLVRVVHVRQVSYGHDHAVRVSFEFRRPKATVGTPRWHIAFLTDLWVSVGGRASSTFASESVPLDDFVRDCRRLGEVVSRGRLSRTIERIFGGPLRLAPKGKDPAHVSIGSDMVWRVRSLAVGQPILSIVDGQIGADYFEFSWRERTSSTERFFYGRSPEATASQVAPQIPLEPLVLGLRTGHHIELTAANVPTPQGAWKLEVRVSASPLKPKVQQTVVAVQIGDGILNAKDGSRLIAGPVRAKGLILTSTLIPSFKPEGDRQSFAARYRTVLWGMTAPVTESAGAEPLAQAWIRTPIGALKIAPWPIDGQYSSATAEVSDGVPSDVSQRLFAAATGDQGGTSGATLFIVADRDPDKPNSELRRSSIDASLVASSLALPDVSFSRLEFDRAELRLHFEDGKRLTGESFAEYPRPLARSHVWIGAETSKVGQHSAEAVRAVLDLSRATLTCGRDYDLVKLRLSFRELELVCRDAAVPQIRAVRPDCRVLVGSNGEFEDTRPLLIAEFDPQHVLEEAVFRPDPVDLPDIEVPGTPDRAAMLTQLAALSPDDRAARAKLRRTWLDEKRKSGDVFGKFADAFRSAAAAARLPEDQQIYIGPFALDPDAMAIARAVQKNEVAARLSQFVTDLLGRVDGTLADLKTNASRPGLTEPIDGPKIDEKEPASRSAARDKALRNESILERLEPLYGYFREHWRSEIARARSVVSNQPPDRDSLLQGAIRARPMGWLDEYLSPSNRPSPLTDDAAGNGRPAPVGTPASLLDAYALVRESIKLSFVQVINGREPLPEDGLMGARLAARSRLAFRINCSPAEGLSAEEAGLPDGSGNGPHAPGSGSTLLPIMPFTFEALTDWSRHEPAVTRRAQRLYDALPSGVLPPVGDRAPNASDKDVLAFQRIPPGPVSGAQRMDQVRAALAVVPNASETAIEIPARLVLSTAQDAVWMTPRRLPDVKTLDGGKPAAGSRPFALDDGTAVLMPGTPELPRPRHLWAARLFVDELRPGVRAVSSSDLRPQGLDGFRGASEGREPGHGAPPRGPWAPWFLGPEQTDAGGLSPDDVATEILGKPTVGTCEPQSVAGKGGAEWRLVRWLCERVGLRKRLPLENYTLFRTSLDAYDRHQLVLLTSAYGLPVTGKRLSLDAEGKRSGALVADSGQIEPGDDYALLDGRDDQAIYRPAPLDVRELALTALGGTLLHDTTFKPAAGADDVYGNKIFEGFSIERWQHEIVLGRDIRAEVVYKGYLLPLGHRASLVKLTERIFLRTAKGGIKAILRQRMYVRIATPEKTYPAIGQPFEGRLWCGKKVTLRTVRTPDIVDPTMPLGDPPSATRPEGLSGRIYLDRQSGLAFWPRTDLTRDGLVKFEVDIEGASCRMPMLFVDNIAATTAKALTAAANHYNGKIPTPQLPESASAPTQEDLTKTIADLNTEMGVRRTIDLHGQTLQLADSAKPDDTRFEIETFEIRVHGRSEGTFKSWTGPLDQYRTTGALEGAEQPAFYPRVHQFKLRLGRVARFSGLPNLSVVARYDGHYVHYGFPKTTPRLGEVPPNAEDNTAEVFLTFDNVVPLQMGANGNRSAGIGRPESWLIGLGRKYGPVGGGEGETIVWQVGPSHENPFLKKIIDRPHPKELAKLTSPGFDATTQEHLVSLAYYLGWNNRLQGRAAVAPAPPPPSSASPPVRPAKLIEDKSTLSRLQVLQSYLSGDAKVLGTIRIRDLLALLDINNLSFPALEEITEYGTALAREGESALEDQIADFRQRVLKPLRDVVSRLQRQWNDMDMSFVKRQVDAGAVKSVCEALRLASIYPEIDAGLKSVQQALDATLKVDRIVELPGPMAALYEACKRLIASLAALASHPVERLERALTDNLLARVKSLESTMVERSKHLSAAQALQNALRARSAEQLADWLRGQLDPSIEPPPSPFLVPPTKNLLDKAGDYIANIVKAAPDETWADALITVTAPPPDLTAHTRAWFDASVAPMPPAIEGALIPIAQKFAKEVRNGSAEILKTALLHAFVAEMKATGSRPSADWVDETVASAATKFADVVSSAAKSAAKQAEQEIGKLKLAAEHDADALLIRLRTDLESWAKDTELRLQGMVAAKVNASPELVATAAAVQRIIGTARKLDTLLDAVDKGQPGIALSTAAAVIQDIIGIDVRTALQDSEIAKNLRTSNNLLTQYQADVLSAAVTGLSATEPGLDALRKLRQEIAACAEYRDGNYAKLPPSTRPCSTTVIEALAGASDKVVALVPDLVDVRTQLKQARKDIQKLVPREVDDLLDHTDALIKLVGEDDGDASALRRRFKTLLCDVIETTYAARCLIEQAAKAPPPNAARFDRDALDRTARQARALRAACVAIATTLAGLINVLKERKNTLGAVAGIGLLGATAATVAQTKGIPAKWTAAFTSLASKLAQSERGVVEALVAGINAASALAREFGSVSVAGIRSLATAMQEARGALDTLGLDVEPQAGELLARLATLEQRIQQIATIRPITTADLKSPTFDGVLSWATGPDQADVGITFGSLIGGNTFQSIATGAREAELAVAAAWHALHARLDGLPDRARRAIEAIVFRTTADGGVLSQLKTLYDGLVDLRRTIHERLSANAITQPLALELLVEQATIYATSPAKGQPITLANDLLAQERDVLKALAAAAPAIDPANGLSATLRNDLIMFLGSWSHRAAAPQRLLAKANDVVKSVSRGDLLSVVDLGAFRDQLEDSIAAMIPTRRKLSYTFSSRVTQEPDTKALFQPKLGSEFSLQAIGIVDLLRPDKSSFEASGAIGPFSVKLVGGLIDAVELKFRGAAFEMVEGKKPRFDVAFDDFVIRPALDFVKQLEPLLSPKDGNGVFIQPMTRTAGIESGFRINLPSIGVGATSFFNISLNVSAELPFDDSEGLFKVSLGRRLAPFSMSVVPFCGSGFFSIYCGADGIRGFEASFEFGAGGSLQFGPLLAQCRVQVGVYVNDLTIGDQRITQIFGTFFAGGSATLWIFSFSTCLYVRLGQQNGGSMYGDAVYSFSFSLGLAKYNYSVTAFHTEQPIGKGSGSRPSRGSSATGGGNSAGGGRQSDIAAANRSLRAAEHRAATESSRVAWARNGETAGVLIASSQSDSSTYRSYFEMAADSSRRATEQHASSRPAGSRTSEAAVVSAASSQSEWSTYRRYFDDDLLKDMKGVLA